jgi:uncharacterized membrane protein
MFFGEIRSRLEAGGWIFNEFRSGAVNLLPILLISKLTKPFFELSNVNLLILGRVFYLILLGLGTAFYLYRITQLISGNRKIALLCIFLFTVSPYCMSVSRYWYPDHYIYFFSAGFLFYFLRAQVDERLSDYILSGLFLGLTISTKYTGAILLLCLPLAIVARLISKDIPPPIKFIK